MGPPRQGGAALVRQAAPVQLGPPWVRVDWYVLSGLTAAVIVVVGLFLAFTQSISSTVQPSPSPTLTSFTLKSGDGLNFRCGLGITVGGSQDTVASIDGDRITLAQPLSSPPTQGTSVSQSPLLPATFRYCAGVAATPAPTTTQLTLEGGAGQLFGPCGVSGQSSCGSEAVTIGGQLTSIKSVDSGPGYRITLAGALASAPGPGTPLSTDDVPTTGALIGSPLYLIVSQIAIVTLAVAALLARPMAAKLRRKPRTRIMETLVFGALIAVVDLLVASLLGGALGSASVAGAVLAQLAAAAVGFLVVPAVYPAVARMFQPRAPRSGQPARSAGRGR